MIIYCTAGIGMWAVENRLRSTGPNSLLLAYWHIIRHRCNGTFALLYRQRNCCRTDYFTVSAWCVTGPGLLAVTSCLAGCRSLRRHLTTCSRQRTTARRTPSVVGITRLVVRLQLKLSSRYYHVSNTAPCSRVLWLDADYVFFPGCARHCVASDRTIGRVHSVFSVVGVSECIIMGIPMSIGTGIFKLLHKYPSYTCCRHDSPLFTQNHRDATRRDATQHNLIE